MEVRFDIRVVPVDGVLGERVEVVLREPVAIPADLQHVLDTDADELKREIDAAAKEGAAV